MRKKPSSDACNIVTPCQRRRALFLVQDYMLREVQSMMLTAKDMEARFTAGSLEIPDTVPVLRHAAGVLLGIARQVPVHPEVPAGVASTPLPTLDPEEVLP